MKTSHSRGRRLKSSRSTSQTQDWHPDYQRVPNLDDRERTTQFESAQKIWKATSPKRCQMTSKRAEASPRRGAPRIGRFKRPWDTARDTRVGARSDAATWQCLRKLNMLVPSYSTITFLGIYPEEWKTCVHAKPCTWTSTAVLLIMTPNWKSPRCPWVGE